MRFKLSTLFWMMGISAAALALVFIAPLALTFFVLSFSLLISPAVWISGAIFGRGSKRAFFIGGLSCGFLPHIVTTFYMLTVLPSSIVEIETVEWFRLGIGEGREMLSYRIIGAIGWLVPGVFATSGGLVAVLTHRWVASGPAVEVQMGVESSLKQQDTPNLIRSSLLSRQVVSGRLETVSFDDVRDS